jgi:hypothetical protein
MEQKPHPRHWINKAELLFFFAHQLMSTIGAIVLGVLFVLLIALLSASLTRNTSGGNFIDHITQQPASTLLNQPYYVAPVLCGLALGALSRYFVRPRWAAWVWVLPMIILLWNLLTWKGAGPPTTAVYWEDVWGNYFGSDCGGSECMYEVFVTVPFYTSVAYSLGAITVCLLRNRNVTEHHA